MDWKSLIGTVAPGLATALGGPLAGLAVETISKALLGKSDGKEDEIAEALQAGNPETLLKLKEAENEFQLKCKEIDANLRNIIETETTKQIEAVNQTMQAESSNSGAEAWYQKAWRPFNGFVVGLGSFVSVVFVCWLFYVAIQTKDATAISIIPNLAFNVATILAIPGAAVGITAWHRGVMQRECSKQ